MGFHGKWFFMFFFYFINESDTCILLSVNDICYWVEYIYITGKVIIIKDKVQIIIKYCVLYWSLVYNILFLCINVNF